MCFSDENLCRLSKVNIPLAGIIISTYAFKDLLKVCKNPYRLVTEIRDVFIPTQNDYGKLPARQLGGRMYSKSVTKTQKS